MAGRSMPHEVVSGETCSWCFEPCDPQHAELVLLDCDQCGWHQYHAACYIKRTNPRQRKALERGDVPRDQVSCPRMGDDGLCQGCVTGFSELREKRAPPAPLPARMPAFIEEQDDGGGWQEVGGEGPPSLSIVVRDIPVGVVLEAIQLYFSQFGEVVECVPEEDGPGVVVTFDREAAVQNVLRDSPHSFDGVTQIDVRRLKIPQRSAKVSSSSTCRLFVGRLPLHTTEWAIYEHFSQFGEVRKINMPQPFKGVATVIFKHKASIDLALSAPTHMISGSVVLVKRWVHQPKATGMQVLNLCSAWKKVQQGNVYDPWEDLEPSPEVVHNLAGRRIAKGAKQQRDLDVALAESAKLFEMQEMRKQETSIFVDEHIQKALEESEETASAVRPPSLDPNFDANVCRALEESRRLAAAALSSRVDEEQELALVLAESRKLAESAARTREDADEELEEQIRAAIAESQRLAAEKKGRYSSYETPGGPMAWDSVGAKHGSAKSWKTTETPIDHGGDGGTGLTPLDVNKDDGGTYLMHEVETTLVQEMQDSGLYGVPIATLTALLRRHQYNVGEAMNAFFDEDEADTQSPEQVGYTTTPDSSEQSCGYLASSSAGPNDMIADYGRAPAQHTEKSQDVWHGGSATTIVQMGLIAEANVPSRLHQEGDGVTGVHHAEWTGAATKANVMLPVEVAPAGGVRDKKKSSSDSAVQQENGPTLGYDPLGRGRAPVSQDVYAVLDGEDSELVDELAGLLLS